MKHQLESELEAKLQEDEELARQLSQELEREHELQECSQLEADSRYAQEIQSNIDRIEDKVLDAQAASREEKDADDDDDEKGQPGQSCAQQATARVHADELLTKKLLTQSAREAYERSLSQKIFSTHDTSHLSAIASQWNDCQVEVSNVMNGICISLLLPHLKSLKVKFNSKNTLVSIEASRMILPNDTTATRQNSFYSAEFEIQGAGIQLTEEDMSYNYSSETGLLHIYLEQVEMMGKEDKGTEGRRGSGRGGRGRYWFNKESFMRIFNKK